MNAVFTIVAKNYLASAITLVKSVKKFHQDVDCYIVLSDEWESEEQSKKTDENIFIAKDMQIPCYEQMSYMYDVVEFATAIKPFFILYLMNEKNYENVVYLDPDIWLLDSISVIWKNLDIYDCVLTPHIVDMNIATNYRKESHILNRGIFNLGFIGVHKNKNMCDFISWWSQRLTTECVRNSTLFVDQKWIDYLPAFCDNFYILRSKAYNIADWNLHERKIHKENGIYCVFEVTGQYEPIHFFHFSGIKQQKPEEYFNKIHFNGTQDEKVALSELILEYEKNLCVNEYQYWSLQSYKYNYYENNDKINLLHRRLYRQLLLEGKKMTFPFSTNEGNFYSLLKKEHLLEDNKILMKMGKENFQQVPKIKKKIRNGKHSFSKKTITFLIKAILYFQGIQRYRDYLNIVNNVTDLDNQKIWFENI